MDFFDEAINRAKEAFDIACKKTNEVVHIGKQKFDIASIENKRAKDYEALGVIYFDLIKDNENIGDLTVKALVEEIKAKTKKIAELKEELNASKFKRCCPKCGAVVDDIAVFCTICGERLKKEDE